MEIDLFCRYPIIFNVSKNVKCVYRKVNLTGSCKSKLNQIKYK